jgi:hypothetical protein
LSKDPFTPQARAKALRTRRRNAKLRKKGLLPPTKHGSNGRMEVSPEELRSLATGKNRHTKASIKKMLATREANRKAKLFPVVIDHGTGRPVNGSGAKSNGGPSHAAIVARLILEVADAYQERYAPVTR